MGYEVGGKRGRFSKVEAKKALKGLGIALLGALATYLQDTIPGIDFGEFAPIVVAANSVIVNAIRLWIVDNS